MSRSPSPDPTASRGVFSSRKLEAFNGKYMSADNPIYKGGSIRASASKSINSSFDLGDPKNNNNGINKNNTSSPMIAKPSSGFTLSRGKKTTFEDLVEGRSKAEESDDASTLNGDIRGVQTRMKTLRKKYLANIFERGEKNKEKLDKMNPVKETKLTRLKQNANRNNKGFDGIGNDMFKHKKQVVDKYYGLGTSFRMSVGQRGVVPSGRFDIDLLQEEQQKYKKEQDDGMIMHSVDPDLPMLLLLGTSRSGKSTMFKQLMALSGHPPNYARAYTPTRKPIETELEFDDTRIAVVDIGGSENDIIEWRFYLSQAEVVVYVVALDEYDLLLKFEGPDGVEKDTDDRGNRYSYLQESLDLFSAIINNVAILNSRFVLILNKADKFKKKYCDTKVSFSSVGVYKNPPTSHDFDAGLNYIKDLFLERADEFERDVQVEVTSAVEYEEVEDVLLRITASMVKGKEVTKWKNLL